MNLLTSNNEALSVVLSAELIKKIGEIDNSKFLLFLPLILNEELVRYLQRGKIRSFEELIAKKSNILNDFDSTYEELLPLSLNTITILNSMHILDHKNGKLIFTGKNEDFEDYSGGKYVSKRLKVLDKIILLLRSNSENLYLQLRVIL